MLVFTNYFYSQLYLGRGEMLKNAVRVKLFYNYVSSINIFHYFCE